MEHTRPAVGRRRASHGPRHPRGPPAAARATPRGPPAVARAAPRGPWCWFPLTGHGGSELGAPCHPRPSPSPPAALGGRRGPCPGSRPGSALARVGPVGEKSRWRSLLAGGVPSPGSGARPTHGLLGASVWVTAAPTPEPPPVGREVPMLAAGPTPSARRCGGGRGERGPRAAGSWVFGGR